MAEQRHGRDGPSGRPPGGRPPGGRPPGGRPPGGGPPGGGPPGGRPAGGRPPGRGRPPHRGRPLRIQIPVRGRPPMQRQERPLPPPQHYQWTIVSINPWAERLGFPPDEQPANPEPVGPPVRQLPPPPPAIPPSQLHELTKKAFESRWAHASCQLQARIMQIFPEPVQPRLATPPPMPQPQLPQADMIIENDWTNSDTDEDDGGRANNQ